MKNGKYTRRSSGMKVTSVLLAALLLVGCSIGATLAWLTATTNEVQNTFTVGKVNITLQEHKYVEGTNSLDPSETTNANTYKLIPGKNMPKDPFVTVKANSEKCWLFVAIKEENNPEIIDESATANDPAVQYGVNDGTWKKLSDESIEFQEGYEVYFCVQDAVKADKNVYILKPYGCNETDHKNGCVTINRKVTSENTGSPTLTFTAAAIQFDGFEYDEDDEAGTSYQTAAAEAFNNLPDEFKNAVLKPAGSETPET